MNQSPYLRRVSQTQFEFAGSGIQGRVSPELNRLKTEDRAGHDWYRFVLSFPSHLVQHYVERFALGRDTLLLDPFCGTGTTLVECQKLGIPCVGIERHPMACFASQVKVDWNVDAPGLLAHAQTVADLTAQRLSHQGIDDQSLLSKAPEELLWSLPVEQSRLLISRSISPLPLHKTLVLLDTLRKHRDKRYDRHERVALATALVSGISNLYFGPEVGVRRPKVDAPVVSTWLKRVRAMAQDLASLSLTSSPRAKVYQGDSRRISSILGPASVDAVITSPPYPNEKDYTRTTRLESVLLGFVTEKMHLRALKRELIRSNTRGVYKDDTDDRLVARHEGIQQIAAEIERRRISLGKTSGFERQYARVTKLYFGGMVRHLSELRRVLRPGAHLAYVVGDQASYLRVMIRTGRILADLAQSLGYSVTGIDLFRTRFSTVSKEHLREEVVLMKWPGTARIGETGYE